MSSCSSCGLSIPDGQGSSCSMCYGDISYGSDGYYEEWARQQETDYLKRLKSAQSNKSTTQTEEEK